MTIQEVCKEFNISPDTLRYYERIGVIPPVSRTKGGQRNYTEDDIVWVQNAICMKNAGLSMDKLVKYVHLYQEGDENFRERYDLLLEAKKKVEEQIRKGEEILNQLSYKLARYKEAMETGILKWNQ